MLKCPEYADHKQVFSFQAINQVHQETINNILSRPWATDLLHECPELVQVELGDPQLLLQVTLGRCGLHRARQGRHLVLDNNKIVTWNTFCCLRHWLVISRSCIGQSLKQFSLFFGKHSWPIVIYKRDFTKKRFLLVHITFAVNSELNEFTFLIFTKLRLS